MKICYFGTYESDYIRNRVLISGLEQNGVEVIHCRDTAPGLKKYINLWRKHKLIKNDYDVMIVGFSGQAMMPLAKILSRKKIVFDGLVPLHDAIVYNHKSIRPISLRALYYWLLDFIAAHLADLVLTDTAEHIFFYHRKFYVNQKKFLRLFVGADETIFFPRTHVKSKDDFVVEFHAFVYAEHGVDYIIDAAQILKSIHPDIRFVMIGASVQYDQAAERAKKLNLSNMEFTGRKPLREIPEYLAEADVCLGLFGKTEKTQRVIPNKAFEILASRRPLINSDGAGVRELLKNGENCILCEPASGQSLADAIIKLKNDSALRQKIADNGYELFRQSLRPVALGKQLKDRLIEMI